MPHLALLIAIVFNQLQGLIPNSNGTAVASNGANLYVGQFSKGD